ncbi:g5623 [Coccomyxa viridis]|uniref:G5623 protein n=1 Tax=Coccomyxa viridis TaxID=1274662 RepID=A0ABP1FVK0_9CHLO
MQRVKVYRLNSDGLWDDKGTGHVSVEYLEQSDSLGLVVISEEDTHRTLLIHRIVFEDIYYRQGDDTIITWSDPEIGTDIALSFQESVGCSLIWEKINEAQQSMKLGPHHQEFGAPEAAARRCVVDEYEQAASAAEGEFPDGAPSGPVELPAAEMGNLAELAKALSELSPFQRERGAAQMLKPGYVRSLLDIFQQCEDLEDGESLRHLYHIIRGAIMLNDANLLDLLLAEENVMDMVGALEYDPELVMQQHHRDFLRDKVVFKEVVPIADPALRAKIHQTYRLAYLKDVVLPRVLDDATFATFSSLILFNNVEVVMALQGDAKFLPELFQRLKSSESRDKEWLDQVAFLQELCSLGKHLQAVSRTHLLTKLIKLGLFEVMMTVLRVGGNDMCQRATDVLLSVVQHDAGPLRDYFTEHAERDDFRILLKPLLSGQEVALQESVLEILRALLDPSSMTMKAATATEQNAFLELFYDRYISQLIGVLAEACEPNRAPSSHAVSEAGQAGRPGQAGAAPSALAIIVDLLCFCVQHHSYRIKYYVLRNNVVEKVLRLLYRREKWLVVAAVRFLRTCIGLKDDFYNRYLVRNNLLEPVIQVFLKNGPRYNLLNSAVLEMVEFIRKENIKYIIAHLVEQYGAQLEPCDHIGTFAALKLKFEQNQESLGGYGEEGSFPATASTAAAQQALTQSRQRRDERALDKDEEDYFKEDDDENDTMSCIVGNGVARPPGVVTGGFSLSSLVEYGEDEDDDEDSLKNGAREGGTQKRGPGRPAGGSPGSPVSPKRARLAEERPRGLKFQTMEPANGVSLWRR